MDRAEATVRLKRFLGAEIVRPRRFLRKAGRADASAAVHDARKSIKKLRAALRLADGMAEPAAREAVAGPLREAAHRLGPLRDAIVLGTTSRDLLKRGEAPLSAPSPTPAAGPLLQEARAQLRSAEMGLRRLLELELDFKPMRKNLRHLYQRARDEMRRADKSRTDEALHAWRRRAKDLFYNLDLIGAPAGFVKKLKRLTELLGDDHDLAFFIQHHASPSELEAHAKLFRRAGKKRARLQRKAFKLGARLFHEGPKSIGGALLSH